MPVIEPRGFVAGLDSARAVSNFTAVTPVAQYANPNSRSNSVAKQ